MSKFSKKLISSVVPAANTTGVYSAVEQLQNLTALTITAVNPCADINGTDGGLGDDTAVNTTGGFVKLTGSGFVGGTTKVYINGVQVTYGYLSNTAIVATVPAGASGTTASLIVFNGSTVGSIWASGITYSGSPTWTTSALAGGSFVVNAQLVASGDAPLTYTFVSGTLPPNCTISSSGLLSGTITGVSANTIYTFTVAVTDAQNQNVSQSIVYTLIVSDPYYRFTSLHITGDTGSTWITDASSNTSAVTSVGSPQATTFSPVKEGYYGNSFDGSLSYLTATSSALAGLFTIEFWLYKNAATGAISIGDSLNSTGIEFTLATTLGIYSNNAYQLGGGSGPTLSLNQWMHIALTRDVSNVTRLFLNGTQVGSTWTTTATFSNIIRIGVEYYNGAVGGSGYYVNGYVSNLRIVNGTCLYTTAFTPPTTALTAITNTVLLTCQSNRFVDNSTTAAAITVTGTPKVVSSNPFNLPAGLATYGSGYFNGSPDYLSVPSNVAFQFGTGEFTVECWVNKPAAQNSTIVDTRSSQAALPWGVFVDASNFPYFYDGTVYTSTVAIVNSTWNHIAVVRTSGVLKIFVNGVQGYSNSHSVSLNATGAANIGGTAAYFIGYISNLRIVKGTAVYTATFTPPSLASLTSAGSTSAAAYPSTTNVNTSFASSATSLLTLQTNVPHNNSQFRDTSTNNALVTRNGNTTQGSFSPFPKQYPYSTTLVGGSAYFDGAGDYLTLPKTSAMDFGAGDFTVECWIWKSTTVVSYGVVCMIGSGGSGYYGFTLEVSSTRGYAWYTQPSPTFVLLNHNVNPDDSQWHHFAVSRTGNTTTLYVDGIARSTSSTAYTIPSNGSNCTIGAEPTPGNFYSGYISNFRMIKGTGLYPANFTPPTAPLTPTSNTTVLLPFSNAALYDNAMLNDFETVGDTKVSSAQIKYGSGSMYFDGSGDYIALPAKQTGAFGTGNFAIECWFYVTSVAPAYQAIIAQRTGDTTGTIGWSMRLGSSTFAVDISDGTTNYTLSHQTTVSVNTWYHGALVRYGNIITLYLNGTANLSPQTVASTYALNGSGTTIYVGYASSGSSLSTFNGYIDDLRITKGAARYTTAFTPSTSAFSTSAPVGTSTLIPKSLRFRSSASAYLSRTAATAISTFTLSMWVKRGTMTSNYQYLFSYRVSGDEYGLAFNITTDTLYVYSGTAQATTAVFRDPAAWYHIVLSNNAGAFTLYVNNVSVKTGTIATIPSGALLDIGRYGWTSPNYYFDGEMAEVNFVDSLALDPTVFGAYSTYNQWLPITYSGYWGVNGFYLPFSDTTSTSTLVADSSGNANNWTPNNISLTAGSTYDSLTDVPTLTSLTAANYCVINPLSSTLNSGTISNGNLKNVSAFDGSGCIAYGTIGVTSGKFYFEVESVSNGGRGQSTLGIYTNNSGLVKYSGDGGDTGYTTYGTYGVAFDVDAGKLWYRNSSGSWVSGDPATGTSPTSTFTANLTTFPYCGTNRTSGFTNSGIGTWNFGQQPFTYTPPTGFLALNTYNI